MSGCLQSHSTATCTTPSTPTLTTTHGHCSAAALSCVHWCRSEALRDFASYLMNANIAVSTKLVFRVSATAMWPAFASMYTPSVLSCCLNILSTPAIALPIKVVFKLLHNHVSLLQQRSGVCRVAQTGMCFWLSRGSNSAALRLIICVAGLRTLM